MYGNQLIKDILFQNFHLQGVGGARLFQSVWRSSRCLSTKGLLHERAQRSGLRRVSSKNRTAHLNINSNLFINLCS